MVKNLKPIILDFSVMTIGVLKESLSVLQEVKPDPIVNLMVNKIRSEITRRNENAK